ncbi:MAG: Cof-type HAD-IIB family hydrolase [Propioniciclava sp.]|uniref:Cof-type HAD-IIB family hydrolase n=1 Tax=Propioniciclava sp. TaxID=2038686 RepID=UPI0039E44128
MLKRTWRTPAGAELIITHRRKAELTVRISLVAVDMDGTFLRPDMTYDRERFLRLRQRMRKAGVRFVVASGNQYWQLRSFFEPADEVAYVAENGHFLYDIGDEAPFHAPAPRRGAGRLMVSALEERGLTYLVSTPDGGLVPSRFSEQDLAWARRFFPRMRVVDDVLEFADDIVKATLQLENPRAFVSEFQALLEGEFTAVVAGPEDADLNAPGYNKAFGLECLSHRWGVDLAEAVAFGDSYNDLEMLQAVGLSVAMANAPQDIRDIADRVAPSNSEDGVLGILEELLPR